MKPERKSSSEDVNLERDALGSERVHPGYRESEEPGQRLCRSRDRATHRFVLRSPGTPVSATVPVEQRTL